MRMSKKNSFRHGGRNAREPQAVSKTATSATAYGYRRRRLLQNWQNTR